MNAPTPKRSVPGVTTVIPCRNEAPYLPRLLADLAAQDYEGQLEVIVADGTSEDGSAQIIDAAAVSIPWSSSARVLRRIPNPDRTIPCAMNRGVSAASHGFIVRVDAHATVPPDYVRKLTEVIVRGELHVVGPRKEFLPPSNSLVARCIARAVSSRVARGKTELPQRASFIRPVIHAGLSCYARSTFLSVGGFDETLRSNEDFDFDYRCHKKGYRVGVRTDIVFYSFSKSSLIDLARQRLRYGFWRSQSLMQRPASLQPRQIAPVILVWYLGAWIGALIAGGQIAVPMSIVVGGYALVLIGAGGVLGNRELGIRGVVLIAAALFVVHVAWGLGFLAGGVSRVLGSLRSIGDNATSN